MSKKQTVKIHVITNKRGVKMSTKRTKITTVGQLRKALKNHDDDAPVGIFSWEPDGDDVQNHEIEYVDTGWWLDSKKYPEGDKRTINICFIRKATE